MPAGVGVAGVGTWHMPQKPLDIDHSHQRQPHRYHSTDITVEQKPRRHSSWLTPRSASASARPGLGARMGMVRLRVLLLGSLSLTAAARDCTTFDVRGLHVDVDDAKVGAICTVAAALTQINKHRSQPKKKCG